MADEPQPETPTVPEVRARLEAAAQMLGESTAVDPAVRSSLGELLSELSRALEAANATPAEVARLADGAARLAEALHHRHDRGLLEASRDRLEGLVRQAEARAPLVVRLARNVIEALADLGI
jgi:ABC-type transporter Mla subunit MlaD